MKILLYGGTFDPPHNGHIHNLKTAVELVSPDKIWVMPAGVPPHKMASKTNAQMRLSFCACFAEYAAQENLPKLTVSDWEITRAQEGKPSYTVHTLKMLAETYPDATLYFCIGSDMLQSFTTWYQWETILSLAIAVVESREDGDHARLAEIARQIDPSGTRILLAKAPALPMASKDLREKLARGEDCAPFLPKSVLEKITENQVYS